MYNKYNFKDEKEQKREKITLWSSLMKCLGL